MKMTQFTKSEIWAISYWGAGHAAIVRAKERYPNTVVPIFLGNLESRTLFSEMNTTALLYTEKNELFTSLLKECNAHLDKVELRETREGNALCQLHITHNGRHCSIPTKPLEALSLMMQTGCDLLVDKGVFTRSGIPIEEASALASERLSKKLEEAVVSENYELAARIRDQLVQMY